MLAALGATSTSLAGCLDFLSEDESGEGGNTSGNDNGGKKTDDASIRWPAIEEGELLSDFENLNEWYPRTGEISAAPDEARTGSQAAVIESNGGEAGMGLRFSDSLNFEEWDTSLAVKPESVNRIIVEFIAPNRSERLTHVRIVPDDYDDWFRLDCGYEHKPDDEPDLSNVTGLNIVADGPEGGPTKMLVDDLRRTESVDNGKAILALYGGYDSHYDIAAEMLEERGWSAAVPVSPSQIGDNGRMDVEELQDLQDRSWDICSYPQVSTALPEQPENRQRRVLEDVQETLENNGFTDGSRHLFVPDDRMDSTTHDVVRDVHESAFLSGSGTVGVPPTGIHMIPLIWGPALHNGVRRHINLADQYNLLTVIRVPRIVEESDVNVNENRISLNDFEALLTHIELRGLDVITPSDLVDRTFESNTSGQDVNTERPDGVILEAGQSREFDGSGSDESTAFDLDDGVLIGEFSHNGDSEFVVEVAADSGSGRNEMLMNTAGNTTGESIITVEEGTYRLNVDAGDTWSIDLSQPEVHGDDLEELPAEASGTGSSFVGPLWTEKDVSLTLTHNGDGKFVVDGYGADGSKEQIVSQIGEFDNSRSYKAGETVWINIEATGDWTLEANNA
ncbi:polysaccharide deacetylase family protein [Natrinema zhouii]|uniref:polysaccharide deacetylase family protein n=1 Tax=Natrinema zhouii TaxID=1710539 RepID=UPI003CE46CB5